MPTTNTTYAEALASTPKPLRQWPGFATVEYSPTVGLSPRRRVNTVLLYNGTPVHQGTRSDILALLGHAPTRSGWIRAAAVAAAPPPATRSYTVGLPVTVTVSDDGTVSYVVHVEDAPGAITDLTDEDTEQDDEVLGADAALVEKWIDAHSTDVKGVA